MFLYDFYHMEYQTQTPGYIGQCHESSWSWYDCM